MLIREPKTREDFEKYYELRWRVLRAPWGMPKGSERDDRESESIHVMACVGDEVVGVGRLHLNSSEEAQIRFMAVAEGYRGRGIGGLILEELERRARLMGARRVVLNAREKAVHFYEKHGYRVVAKAHKLFNEIQHWKMMKEL
ncbi:MAG: GNAT family N-acetyltransferase [Thaumarchaeota archaeon]|nr:GNAT family N-acetyltransferase [Nitrososphaerota archaeon]